MLVWRNTGPEKRWVAIGLESEDETVNRKAAMRLRLQEEARLTDNITRLPLKDIHQYQ
jgi:hypothetical protein